MKSTFYERQQGRRTSRLVGSPQSNTSKEVLLESIRVQQSFLSSSSVECGRSTRILRISTENRLSSPSGVSKFRLVQIPMTLPQSGWFTNHSKSFIRFSYVICAFTYRIVELLFVLSYICSRVWWTIEYSGTQCGDYYLIPRRLTALIRWRSYIVQSMWCQRPCQCLWHPRPYGLLWYLQEW
jgi:hypothetical protein